MRFRRGTERGVIIGAALLVCVLSCATATRARQLSGALAQLDEDGRWVNGVTESWWPGEGITNADATSAAARWKEIGDELAREGSEGWAGDYFRGGETSGTYMRWSPRAGFVIAGVNKCEARVRVLVYGRVEATPTLVKFFPEVYKAAPRRGEDESRRQEKAATTPDVIRYVPVEWRGERMLVAEEEMEDFGDFLAGLGDYNGRAAFDYEVTNFFSRSEAHNRPDYSEASGESGEAADSGASTVSGEAVPYAPPVVPPGYERFLKKPVEATVTAVGRVSFKSDYIVELPYASSRQYDLASLTRVTISAGTAQGVKKRMVFRVTEPDEDDTVIVLRVREHDSDAVVIRDADERGREVYYDKETREAMHSKVAAGWRLTTSPF